MTLPIAIALGLACAPPPPPPTPEVRLDGPWREVSRDAAAIVVRTGDAGDGVRIQLARDDRGRLPGVTPIARGDTLDVADGADRWPLVAVAWPDRALTSAVVTSQGPDLLVRFAGPPLREVATADAPTDPVLTWVRLRPRGDSWRVVVDGIATISLPGGGDARARPDGAVEIAGDALEATFETDSPAAASRDDGRRWTFANHGSIAAHAPYPRTALTLRP